MSFLFVDYDAGCGGEYFCSCLSQSPQVEPLEFTIFESGRTKIVDIFNQEFLKLTPDIKKVPTVGKKYNIVPSHRNTALGKKILINVKSIRIDPPTDEYYLNFVRYQALTKVFLQKEPTAEYFLGYLKFLVQHFNNTDFLSKVNRSIDNLSLVLLAQGKEPNEENRRNFIEHNLDINLQPISVTNLSKFGESDDEHDLTIPYKTLINDPTSVIVDLKEKFGIDVELCLLEKYRKDFELYQTQNPTVRY